MSNVLINGRSAVHAGSGGVLTTVDVCLTKVGKSVKPIPYTNVARSADAANTAATVFINGNPVCHKESNFATSTGDEPGNRKRVVSGTIKGKAQFVTASPNVFIEGVPAVRAFDLMVSNNQNTAPAALVQSSGSPPPALVAGTSADQQAAAGPNALAIAVGTAGDELISARIGVEEMPE